MQPGWLDETKHVFDSFEDLGQFGFIEMSDAKEFQYIIKEADNGAKINIGPSNVGGPNVVLKKLWDDGLRYNEMPWQNFGAPTPQEDVKLSLNIKSMGYWFGNTASKICVEQSFGNTDKYFGYYQDTFARRGHAAPDRTLNGEVLESVSGSDHI
jgi:hypothetical protein